MSRTWARILPLVPLVAWIVTLFIPIWASPGVGPRITVSSLGRDVLSQEYADIIANNPGMLSREILESIPGVLVLLGLILLAAYSWRRRPGVPWSIAILAAAAMIAIYLMSNTLDPQTLLWDGIDARGRMIGGIEVARPWWGMIFWVLGTAALVGAGIAGLLGRIGPRRPSA